MPINAIRFQGDLIVAELGTTSVVRANGEDLTQRETLATLVVPSGLTATDNDLWVSDWATGTVWQLIADGETLTEPQMVGSGFAFPEGLAKLPVVLFPDGTYLSAPSNLTLAEKVGLHTQASNPFYDVVVVGGGPAGLANTVYAATEGLSVVLVEQSAPGGQAGTSSRTENYLGFPNGITGVGVISPTSS